MGRFAAHSERYMKSSMGNKLPILPLPLDDESYVALMRPSFLLSRRISFHTAVIVLIFADTIYYESELKFLVP